MEKKKLEENSLSRMKKEEIEKLQCVKKKGNNYLSEEKIT